MVNDNPTKNTQTILLIVAGVVIAVGAVFFLTAPDERTLGEKANDAVEQLDNGVDNAAREFEDRTPAERIRDDVEDATDSNE